MSSREKNLLSLLLIVGLIAGVLIGYKKFYEPRYQDAERNLAEAKAKIDIAKTQLDSASVFEAEMLWITNNEREPLSEQNAQSSLQGFCQETAEGHGLTIKQQRPLASIRTEGAHYNRARMDMIVTGEESNFYNWIATLDDPSEFRAITSLTLYPLKEDDTKIESRLTIEQWFIPETL